MAGIPGRLRRFSVVPAAVCAAAGCGGGDAPAEERIEGQRAYAVSCGYCHDVPNGIGAALTPKVLAGYGTVGALDRYLRAAMPHEAPGSLSGAEYDAILQHLLDSRDLVPDGVDHDPPDSTRLREPGADSLGVSERSECGLFPRAAARTPARRPGTGFRWRRAGSVS